MKRLGKLSINIDKVMKNEELVNLRGGDYYSGTDCYGCRCGSVPNYTSGVFDVYVDYNDIEAALREAVAQCGGYGYTATCKLDWCTTPYYA